MKLKQLSAYARPESHLTRQTMHGAFVTVLGLVLALTLGGNEMHHFLKLSRTTKLAVDVQRRHDLSIYLDVSFPSVPCAVLSIDALDVSGTSENDASFAKGFDLHKIRLDKDGRKIGRAEYHTPQSQRVIEESGGAAMMNVNVPQAMKHLVEMEDEEKGHEGCHLSGSMLVKRVAGRVHISVHQQMVFQLLPQLLGGHHVPVVLNMSHVIHRFSFGPPYPGLVNPLDGYSRIVDTNFANFKYFLKVVPTEYHGRFGGVTETHQYSVTEYSTPIPMDGSKVPALDFLYDLSPIVISVNDRPPSLLHFVVRMCAVIGGVFAVTRMLDRWVHWFFKLTGLTMA